MNERQLQRAKALVKDYSEIDMNDIVADGGITAGMVWAKEVKDLLEVLSQKETWDDD